MRPIYETEADRSREDTVRQYLMHNYNCQYQKAEQLQCYDGVLFRPDGSAFAIVEIKTRKNTKNKYPTYMLSAQKVQRGLEIAKGSNIPFLLVVQFTDGIYCTNLRDDYEMKHGGRYDRGDFRDVEQCFYIPIEEFKKI